MSGTVRHVGVALLVTGLVVPLFAQTLPPLPPFKARVRSPRDVSTTSGVRMALAQPMYYKATFDFTNGYYDGAGIVRSVIQSSKDLTNWVTLTNLPMDGKHYYVTNITTNRVLFFRTGMVSTNWK